VKETINGKKIFDTDDVNIKIKGYINPSIMHIIDEHILYYR